MFFSPIIPNPQHVEPSAAEAAQELTEAQQHFFLPRRYRDPFLNNTVVAYDKNDLFVTTTRDPLGNTVQAEINYRVLQPWRMTDPNGNHSEAAFDTLGLVVASALIGKNGEGDKLEGLKADLPQAELDAFFAAPRPPNPALLGKATTRILYDIDRWRREGKPAFAAILARETHVSDLLPPQGLKIQISFSYSDGFGRETQKKIQAEPGPVVEGGPIVNPRWVGSGWTIFNNKGKPVRQYEPFFSATHDFEFGKQVGVSPVLFYDPAERVVATLHPNHTYEKVVFDPWQQISFDVNDTLKFDPKTDDDVHGFFTRLPDADYLPTWFARMSSSANTHDNHAAQHTEAHADTPTIAHFDALGRPFLTITDNGAQGKYETRVELDIEGNQRSMTDALGRIVMRYHYDMLGSRIKQASMEAGARWMLANVAGKPIRIWDDRGFTRRMIYDELHRPTGLFVTEPAGERLAEQTIYGESKLAPEATNHRGKVWQVFDDAGIVTSEAYDFKGSLLSGKRDLRTEYKTLVNWAQQPAPATSETFASSNKFDALGRVIEAVAPDGSVTLPRYNEANLLEAVEVRLRGAAQPTPFVRNIDYDAKGQRTRIEYNKNDAPIITEYAYDPDTFRLTHLVTARPSHPDADKRLLQELRYTYDPTGNITHIQDDAQQMIYFRNQRVEPSNDYVYNAIYRLISAQGREHLGQTGGQRNSPTAPDAFNRFHTNLDHPGNGDALGIYIEEYDYDAVGNFKAMRHLGSDPAHPGWTRSYAYNEPSLLERTIQKSNRLSSTQIGAGTPEPYTYDAHGNMITMPHLPQMRWDFEDQLTEVDLQGGGTAYYVYDAAGQRVRKVTERQNGSRKAERIYLGGFEIYREFNGNGLDIALERETLHIMDDKQRIALVETKTQGNDGSPLQLIRYQFGNHLGSASLEVDDKAHIISYEEYTPYGSTSYQAVDQSIKAAAKRYRYTGKERDEESGLYYHGARYYAGWLGRWISTDQIGTKGGINFYTYVAGNPIIRHDPDGNQPQPTTTLQNPNEEKSLAKNKEAASSSSALPIAGSAVRIGTTYVGKDALNVELEQIQKDVETEIIPKDKSGSNPQNHPDSPEHREKVIRVINYFIQSTTQADQTKLDNLFRSLEGLTTLRKQNPQYSQSLVLRDAQRYFYGAVSPFLFSNKHEFNQRIDKGQASRIVGPFLSDKRGAVTPLGTVFAKYADLIYNVEKEVSVKFGLEVLMRSDPKNPTSSVGGSNWYIFGAVSHYSSNAEFLAKGSAKLVSSEDLKKYDEVKSTLSEKVEISIGKFVLPKMYIPSISRD